MIEYFKRLTPEELQKFEKFISSPYYTTQKNLIRLFRYLESLYPDIKAEDLEKKQLSIQVYSQKRVNETKMRKLLSDFSILMEKFFAQLEFEKNPETVKTTLLPFLRQKGLKKRFEMNYKEVTKELKNKFSKDEDFYSNQFKTDHEFYYHNFTTHSSENVPYLQSKSDNLDFFYIFSKLHTFNEMLDMEGSKNKNVSYKKTFYNEILEFVRNNIKLLEEHHPNIFIIYNVYMMFETLDDTYLETLLKYLKLHEQKYAQEKLSYYYHYTTQYYIKKINNGQDKYKKDVINIYKLMREKNLFLIDNIITDQEFNNVSNMALSLKEYKWLDDFVEEYQEYIDAPFAEDAANLVKAKLAFYRKDFSNAFIYLNKIGLFDPNYYTNSKYLLGRLHFDTNNIEGVRYIIENLRQYLRSKKNLTPEQSDGIKTFNKYLPELIRVYDCKNSKEKKNLKLILRKQLDNEKKLVPNKNWFYEKLEEIN